MPEDWIVSAKKVFFRQELPFTMRLKYEYNYLKADFNAYFNVSEKLCQ